MCGTNSNEPANLGTMKWNLIGLNIPGFSEYEMGLRKNNVKRMLYDWLGYILEQFYFLEM